MNIIIINCFDTWEHRTDLLLKVLSEDGHNVQVLMSDYCHIGKTRRLEKKEKFIFFSAEPYRRNLSIKRLHSHVQLSRDMFSWVNAHAKNIDYLWVMAPPNSFVKDAGIIKQKYPHIRLLIDLIDLWPETMPFNITKQLPLIHAWQMLRDKNIRYADIVVTECNLYRHVLRKALENIKTETLYLAREDKGYDPELSLPKDKIALCYLGSINNIIDISVIKEIIIEISKKKPVIFHIIGDGENKQKLIKISRAAGAEVIFHGAIYDRGKKKKIYDSCHYGLNIMKDSVCVGLTMKSMDYFEFGLPIINNVRGDTWKIIEKYNCGINVNENNINFDMNSLSKEREKSRSFFENHLTEMVFKKKVKQFFREDSLR